MRSHIRVLILCLLCVACVSTLPSKEITELRIASLESVENISGSSEVQKNNETNLRSTNKLRDKRALGLILSGLAQIFGYNVTPVQVASLPNPNTMISVAPLNSSIFTIAQQLASPTVLSTNATVPRQQETIKFTGVVNFGNNSDILGHLQRYEQIFHGNKTTKDSFITTLRPSTILTSSRDTLLNPRIPSQIRPPLLAPFFVKIPLPIAPNLPPPTLPIGNFKLSYPVSPISILNESEENDDQIPIHKEQETIYRNNEDTEHYSLEQKDIYDDMDVRKPVSKYTHQLYVDEPSWQIDSYNELQRKQQEYIEKLKKQEKEKNRDNNNDDDRDNEDNERHGNRNQGYDPKNGSTDEKNPTYSDEENDGSTEKYQKYPGQTNVPREFSRQETTKSDEKKKEQDIYSDDDDSDVSNKYSNKQPDETPLVNFDKYIESVYNQQLPIGDYFHGHNSEEIRDSYGEVLENKKLKDDRLSSYFGMFKHPYTGMYDPQKIINSENDKQTPLSNNYDEDLTRMQKFNEEYAPENKYEEYDINEEDGVHRENGKIEETHNLNSTLTAKKTKLDDLQDNNNRKETSAESQYDDNDDGAKTEDTKLHEDIDLKILMHYTPLIVPVRYVYANDKIEGRRAKHLQDDESDKFENSEIHQNNTTLTESKENQLIPHIGIPERSHKLHEGEYNKQFQIFPGPFDYIYDDTRQTNAVIPRNLQDNAPSYNQYVVTNNAVTTNKKNSSEESPGFVLDNPVYPSQYPYNYISKEAGNQRNGDPYLNAENTYSHGYFPAQSSSQQYVQVNPNLNQYGSNEALNQPYYYQSQNDAPNIFDQYRYTFDEHIPKPSTIDVRNQILNTENWSGRTYPSQSYANVIDPFSSNLVQRQNIESSNQNAQSESSNNQRYLESPRGQQYLQSGNKHAINRDIKNLTSQFEKHFDNSTGNSHDLFEFHKDDYDFGSENNDTTSKVAQENV